MKNALHTLCCLLLLSCNGDGRVTETHLGALTASDRKLEQNDGSYYDDYRFWTRAGYRISISLKSEEFDPYVHLFDANKNQLAYNDDVADSNNASIEFKAPYQGHYYVLVNSRDPGEMGNYTLQIEATPE